MTGKRLVLDANILIRAVLGRKVLGLLLAHAEYVEFHTPAAAFHEARRYLPALAARRGLSAHAVTASLDALADCVRLVDEAAYRALAAEAHARIAARDVNDWPVVATALLLDCPVWTEDADFFGAGLATWTTDRVHLYLQS